MKIVVAAAAYRLSISVCLVATLLVSARPSSAAAQDAPGGPCADPAYLALRQLRLDSLTPREYDSLVVRDRACASVAPAPNRDDHRGFFIGADLGSSLLTTYCPRCTRRETDPDRLGSGSVLSQAYRLGIGVGPRTMVGLEGHITGGLAGDLSAAGAFVIVQRYQAERSSIFVRGGLGLMTMKYLWRSDQTGFPSFQNTYRSEAPAVLIAVGQDFRFLTHASLTATAAWFGAIGDASLHGTSTWPFATTAANPLYRTDRPSVLVLSMSVQRLGSGSKVRPPGSPCGPGLRQELRRFPVEPTRERVADSPPPADTRDAPSRREFTLLNRRYADCASAAWIGIATEDWSPDSTLGPLTDSGLQRLAGHDDGVLSARSSGTAGWFAVGFAAPVVTLAFWPATVAGIAVGVRPGRAADPPQAVRDSLATKPPEYSAGFRAGYADERKAKQKSAFVRGLTTLGLTVLLVAFVAGEG